MEFVLPILLCWFLWIFLTIAVAGVSLVCFGAIYLTAKPGKRQKLYTIMPQALFIDETYSSAGR
jgi:hypothetical protein